MTDFRDGQEKCKKSLEHLVASQSKEVLKRIIGTWSKDIISLKGLPLAKSGKIPAAKSIMMVKNYNPLNKILRHKSMLI